MMISARTSLKLTRRVLSRATGSALASQVSPSAFMNGSSHGSVAAQFLSTEADKSDAASFVPGVGKNKTSTGLVGLAVEPQWYNGILRNFQALLDKMEASDMPETAQYRIDVTKWCNYVIQKAKENPEDPEAVEDAVQMGQVEELMEMAEDEMIALDTYLSVRMWELVEQSKPKVDFEPDVMKDPFAEGGDQDVADKLREGMEERKDTKK